MKQEIIKLVRLSATGSIRDAGFSSSCISIGTGSLIRIKSVSKLANCSLVLLVQWSFDHEQVEDIGLLAVIVLMVELVAGVFSQLGSLSTKMILGPEIGKTVQPG